MASSTTRTVGIALLSAIAGFVIASLLHAYPKDEVTRHRYCTLCAAHEQTFEQGAIMGAVRAREERSGPLHQIVQAQVGSHEHVFTPWASVFPTFGVEEENPEVARRVRELSGLETSAHSLAMLDAASRQDPERTARLIQRMIALEEPVSTIDALRALERDVPWPERWAAVDALLAGG